MPGRILVEAVLGMEYRIYLWSSIWWSIGESCCHAPKMVWEQCLSQGISICTAKHGHEYPLPIRPSHRLAVPRGRFSKMSDRGKACILIRHQESSEPRKHRRDFGRSVGRFLIRAVKGVFTKKKQGSKWSRKHDDEQGSALLEHRHSSSTSAMKDGGNDDRKYTPAQPPPGYREVFSRQSNINLVVYTFLALHSVTFDQLLPIFMHHPEQRNRSTDPNVHLPFRFAGGFGLDVGLLPFQSSSHSPSSHHHHHHHHHLHHLHH